MSDTYCGKRYIPLVALVLVLVSANVNADIFYNAEVSLHNDDNISTAWRGKDVREDSVVSGVLGARKGVQLSRNSGVSYRGGASYLVHSEFDKLNALAINGGVDYRFRPGESFASPTYNIGLTLTEKLSSSDIRDSTTIDLKLELFTRFSELTSGIFGVGLSTEEAEGVVFDQSRMRLFANLDQMLSEKDTLFFTYVYLDGDVVSTGTPDSLLLTQAAEVLEPDDAFGDGSVGGPVVYRLNAATHILTLGYNRILDKKTSLDFSLRTLTSSADAGIEYDSMTLRASYLMRFK